MFSKTTPADRSPTPPSEDEIVDMVAQLRVPGALAYGKVYTTNRGVGLSLSFNVAKAANASGQLHLVLRQAAVEVTSSLATSAWDWSEDFLALVEDTTTPIERTTSRGEAASLARTRQRDHKFEGAGKIKYPLFEAGGGYSHTRGEKNDARRDSTRNQSDKVTVDTPMIEVYRGARSYSIEFQSGGHENLVPLNPKLNRVSLLDLPEPSSVRPEQVTLDLTLRLGDDDASLHHAFDIRHATGAWKALATSPNKRILGELLFSKFLQPLHQPQRVWPTQEEAP